MSNDSLTKFDRPLRIELKPSPQLTVFSGLIHVLAAASAAFTPELQALRFLLPVLVLAHFGYFIRHQVTARSSRAVKSIAWDRGRGWRVANAAGDWQPVRPRFPVFVSFRLVVVRFRASAFRSRSAVIVADRLSDHEFRRLRVRLLQSTRDSAR